MDLISEETYFYLQDNTTGVSRQLSEANITLIGSYCWTHDQQYLVWGGPQPNGSEMDIYRLEVASGEIVVLTEDSPEWDAFPACSPTDSRIAFVSDRTVENIPTDNIWVMDSQGGNLQQLTNTPGWENKYPAWSPDGQEIAFIRGSGFFGEEKDGPAGLWAVKSDGEESRLILQFEKQVSSWGAPAWSPDGQYIACAISSEENSLSVLLASSGEVVYSSDLPGDNSSLSWSASSQYLIFTNNIEKEYHIYLLAIDGFGLAPLLPESGNMSGMFAPAIGP
jgi:Tol biopolymer transport system component